MDNYNRSRQQRAHFLYGLSEIFDFLSERTIDPQDTRARDVSRSMSFFGESYETNSVMAKAYAICGAVLLGGLIISNLPDKNESQQNH